MPTYYLDLVNGDDTLNGLSYAQRMKTVAAVCPLLQPGDTVIVQSGETAFNTGYNATWTNKSPTVVLSGVLAGSLFDGTLLPGSITPLPDDSKFKYKNYSVQLPITSDLTLGKLGYIQFSGALNVSTFHRVSFWVWNDQPIPANMLSLRICEDGGGNTTRATIPIPAINSVGQWVPVLVDAGTNLPASTASLAFFLDGVPITVNVNIDNVVAIPDAGSVSITHQTLIGKPNSIDILGGSNTESWFAIAGIGPTELVIDNGTNSHSYERRGYYGTTETVPLWTRGAIPTGPATDGSIVANEITSSGTGDNPITWKFGCDTIGVQNSVTLLSGQNGLGVGLKVSGDFNNVSGLGVFRYSYGIHLNASHGGTHDFVIAAHCSNANIYAAGPSSANVITGDFCHNSNGSGYVDRPLGGGNKVIIDSNFCNVEYGAEVAANDMYQDGVLHFNGLAAFLTSGAVRIYRCTTGENGYDLNGVQVAAQGLLGSYYIGPDLDTFVTSRIDPNFNIQWEIGTSPAPGVPHGSLDQFSVLWEGFITAPATDTYTFTVVHDDGVRIWIDDNLLLNTYQNWVATSPQTFVCTLQGGVATKFKLQFNNLLGPATLRVYWQSSTIGKTIIPPSAFSYSSNSGAAVMVDPTTSVSYDVNLHDCVVNEGVQFGGFQNYLNTRTRSHNHMAQKGNHVMQTDGGKVVNETGSDRHTLSGFAWKLSPSSPRCARYPLDYRLASMAVLANSLVTVTAWYKRTSSNITAQLLVPGGQLAGVVNDVSTNAAASGVYEQLSVQFTPTEQGVIDIYARVFGGSNDAVFVDDMGIQQ